MYLYMKNSPYSHSHNQKAFTLIELMVVIMIIAVLAGLLTGTYYKRFRKHKLVENAMRIKAYANYARLASVEKGETYYLMFAADSRVMLCTEALSQDGQLQYMPVSNPYCKPFQLDPQIEIVSFDVDTGSVDSEESTARNRFVKFYPEGGADNAVICMAASTKIVTITISKTTGRSKVFNGRNIDPASMPIDIDLGNTNYDLTTK